MSKPRGLLHFLLFLKMRHTIFCPRAGVFRKMDFLPKADRGRDLAPPPGLGGFAPQLAFCLVPCNLRSGAVHGVLPHLPLEAHQNAWMHASLHAHRGLTRRPSFMTCFCPTNRAALFHDSFFKGGSFSKPKFLGTEGGGGGCFWGFLATLNSFSASI